MLMSLGFGGFAVVGSVLVAKRPNNPVSWIMLTIGLMAGLFPAAETYAAYVMTTCSQPDASPDVLETAMRDVPERHRSPLPCSSTRGSC
jgi:hypothetical protein